MGGVVVLDNLGIPGLDHLALAARISGDHLSNSQSVRRLYAVLANIDLDAIRSSGHRRALHFFFLFYLTSSHASDSFWR